MRTQEEIAERMKERIESGHPFARFWAEALAMFLDWEHAEGIRATETTREEWTAMTKPLERAVVEAVMCDYMDFAWAKALDERSISAARSIMKFEEWVWLLGDDGSLEWDEVEDFAPYGKPILKKISDYYGFPAPAVA